jgi:hypothetical protein
MPVTRDIIIIIIIIIIMYSDFGLSQLSQPFVAWSSLVRHDQFSTIQNTVTYTQTNMWFYCATMVRMRLFA